MVKKIGLGVFTLVCLFAIANLGGLNNLGVVAHHPDSIITIPFTL